MPRVDQRRAAGDSGPDDDLASFAVENAGGGTLVRITGEIDMQTTPELRALLTDLLGSRPRVLVLDLSAVTFFASSGLAALVEARDTATDRGVQLRLAGLSHSVRRPLQITGLATLFETYQDVATALAD